jgi:hypothetical protein
VKYACGHTDAEADALIEAALDRLNAELRGLVIDFVCADCGRRQTERADWAKRPVCCDWEMIDLLGTLRPA